MFLLLLRLGYKVAESLKCATNEVLNDLYICSTSTLNKATIGKNTQTKLGFTTREKTLLKFIALSNYGSLQPIRP